MNTKSQTELDFPLSIKWNFQKAAEPIDSISIS